VKSDDVRFGIEFMEINGDILTVPRVATETQNQSRFAGLLSGGM
jgi:hypothetical protein